MNSSETRSPLIEYKDVTVVRNRRVVLDKVSLSIGQGEHVAILGPNGAGKSSLIKTVTRELYPVSDGSNSYLHLLGREMWDVFELRSRLGIVSADILAGRFGNPTCRQMVLSGFFSSTSIWPHHEVTPEMASRATAILDFLGIQRLSNRKISEVSTGESRLVLIGRALVHDPSTMLLDEPTSSLDPRACLELRQTMRKLAGQGKAIVMITHDLSDIIPEIGRVILIRDGRVVGDGQKADMLTSETLSGLFGVQLEVVRRDGFYHCW